MQRINNKSSSSSILDKIINTAERKEEELKHKKARLMQTILHEWKESHSVNFWRKCFQHVDYKIIKQVYENINDLVLDGYTIKNPAAFFVHTLKEMGHLPFNGGKEHDKR